MLEKILLNAHLIASLTWVGAVFMGTFIDWPAAKETVKEGEFPFRFIVGQGRRVFYSVYFGIILLWTTGIGLVLVHPPQDTRAMWLLAIKVFALFLMTSFTLWGTFFTWPKLQVATHAEAFEHYKYYMYRAQGTFACGLIGSVVGLWVYS